MLADHDRLLRDAARAEEGMPFGSAGDALFAVCRASGGIDLATLVDGIEGREALCVGLLDEAAAASALADGQAMTADQAVAHALRWGADLPGGS